MTISALSSSNANQVTSSFYGDSTALNTIKYSSDQQESLHIVAKQFEAIMYQQVLKSMRAAQDVISDEDNPLSSASSSFARDMYDGQLAQQMIKGRTGSMTDMLIKQLSPHVPNAAPTNTALNSHRDLSFNSTVNKER